MQHRLLALAKHRTPMFPLASLVALRQQQLFVLDAKEFW
jgi:hypothetical protein